MIYVYLTITITDAETVNKAKGAWWQNIKIETDDGWSNIIAYDDFLFSADDINVRSRDFKAGEVCEVILPYYITSAHKAANKEWAKDTINHKYRLVYSHNPVVYTVIS